jgi:hypothetical protein
LPISDKSRISAHRPGAQTRCEKISFNVENITPLRLQQKFFMGILLRFGVKHCVTQHLQIDQAIAQCAKRPTQERCHQREPSQLHSFCHAKIYRPSVAIGSSSDGDTDGGKIICQTGNSFLISFAF